MTLSPLSAERAAIVSVTLMERNYADIFHTARALAEIANVAMTVPNYPELAEHRASWAEMVEQRIVDLMEAING